MNEAQSSANRSETIGKLAAALSKFQAEVENPTKDSQGHNYKYADLANILNAVKQPLTNNKLSVCQMLGSSAQGISVTTILMHESGEYIESMLSLPQEANSRMSAAQQAGAVITYARRYALAACLGIAQQDDDAPKPSVSHSDEEKTEPVNKSATQAKKATEEIAACKSVNDLQLWSLKNSKLLERLKKESRGLNTIVLNCLDERRAEIENLELPVAKIQGEEPDPLPPVPPLISKDEIPF